MRETELEKGATAGPSANTRISIYVSSPAKVCACLFLGCYCQSLLSDRIRCNKGRVRELHESA